MNVSRSRNWVFTEFGELEPSFPCKFIAYQRERCPESGRLHWQGYAHFSNPMGLTGVKKFLPQAHWEVRRGSHDEALDYVTKERTRLAGTLPVVRGDPPEQGKRSDIADFAQAILGGYDNSRLATEFPVSFLRYERGITGLRMACVKNRSWKTKVIVLHGPTGCGKSRWAHDSFPEAYTKDPTKWWNGYCGEEVVILDEFYGQLPHEYMLKLMDRYPLNVELKGGYAKFVAKLIIITSNSAPEDWYSGLSERGIDWKPQFFRRIDHEYKFIDGRWHRNFGSFDAPDYRGCSLPSQELALDRTPSEEGTDPGSVPGMFEGPIIDLTQEE